MPGVRRHTRSFAGGEITPELYGRLDLTKNQTGLRTSLNGWTLPHGPWQNRPGFEYLIHSKDSTKASRVIPFEFNTEQTFAIELGHNYVRWHTNGGTLLEATKTITGITQANPGVVTSNAHGYANGEWVYLSGIVGMTQLNGRYVKVAGATANTFQIQDVLGSNINTTSYTAYSSGGTAARVYEIASTYAESELFDIHYTQSADVLTLVHPNHPPRELRRLGATNWTLTAISFAPTIGAPSGATAAASPASGSKRTRYKVTAIAQDGLEESLASTVATVGAAVAITGVTQANPGVVTAVAHGRAVNDAVYITGVGGMTQLSGEYLVNSTPTADTLTLKTLDGAVIDTTAYSAYTAGGSLYLTDVVNDLSTAGNQNTVSWATVSGAVRYNVYKLKNGLYGYIGQTERLTFADDNITADLTKTPAIADTPFASATNYPGAVGYFAGRRHFAGTDTKPQNYWATRSGTESNLSYSIPTRDDDRIAFRVVSRQANRIRHIVPLSKLVLLTAGGGWIVAPQNSDILTPESAQPDPIDADGANNVQPVIAGKNLLYPQSQGGRVREMKANQFDSANFGTADISIMAPHLFDGYTITDATYVVAPHRMAFFVRSDGVLLGLTYLPEHEVVAWHRHSTAQNATAGYIESVTAVREGSVSALYAVIRRTINGTSVRYIERLHEREDETLADCFYVDAGVTITNPTSYTIANGLWHLEGQSVRVVADGAVLPNATVTAGAITLDLDALPTKVQVGLAITADMELLPPSIEADSALGQGMRKSVNALYLRVLRGSNIKAGPDADHLREYAQRTNENYGSPPRTVSDVVKLIVDSNISEDATVLVRQDKPLPLTVSAATLEIAV